MGVVTKVGMVLLAIDFRLKGNPSPLSEILDLPLLCRTPGQLFDNLGMRPGDEATGQSDPQLTWHAIWYECPVFHPSCNRADTQDRVVKETST